jgi:UDP:flavonoid glycosyltransferase YjiC (YdhE family)
MGEYFHDSFVVIKYKTKHMKQFIHDQVSAIKQVTNGKKVLFACVPGDGHFNPLTGVAVHLKSIGYDVRWYVSGYYAEKVKKLGIHHYPLIDALDVTVDNFDELLPGRDKAKSMVAKLNFDLSNFFIKRGPEYYKDLKTIHQSFPFDVLIADCAFTGIPFVNQLMKVPVIAMGIIPLSETSKDLPPYGLGMVPSYSLFGKIKQGALRWVAENILFAKSNKVLAKICKQYGMPYEGQNVFDYIIKKSSLVLQSATPGFEYKRSDIGKNIRFAGPLLPYTTAKNNTPWFNEKLNKYERIVLVTQGTVEKDVTKLIKPTLDAFKGSGTLVVVTTGGSNTEALRAEYRQDNVIIEDFIPFGDIMPYADVYITNGGYGGVLLGIENQLPMVVAGIHEGKSEICARVGYFKLGINLKTEKPKPAQIARAVATIVANNSYKANVTRLAKEFTTYNTKEIVTASVQSLTGGVKIQQAKENSIY